MLSTCTSKLWIYCIGAPKGSLQKRLQALFTADERPPIQLRPHKPKRRPVTNTPEPSQAEHIQSSESAERSQELNRLFDGCLSLHPSSTIPPHLDPAATRNESSAGSGRALSESGKSSGNVAALVAAFSGSSPNFKQKVSSVSNCNISTPRIRGSFA